jgi:Tfp pilus assembly protein PilX
MPSTQPESKGFALITALLLLMLLSGIAAGLVYVVNTESRLGGTDLESTVAFYGAEAAMEKMMVDLGNLYTTRLSPSAADVTALADTPHQPVLSGITYSEYSLTAAAPTVRQVTSGANEGLVAYIIPTTLTATARRQWGAEIKMIRSVEVALIPVFQFGVFSDSDLSYFAGAGFDFAGRVHTNGNLFLASSADPSGLTLHSKVTAVGEVIRAQLSNGFLIAGSTRDKPIYISTAPAGCDGTRPACRDLQEAEGSKVGGPTSADNANWRNISTSTYHGLIVNGKTGAKPLTLPFVAGSLRPIEIIRRPADGEDPLSLVAGSRLYTIAQIRVLLADRLEDLPDLGAQSRMRLINVAPYYNAPPVPAPNFGTTDTAFAEGRDDINEPGTTAIDLKRPPNPGPCISDPPNQAHCFPLIDGYLQVQRRNADDTYTAVTREWLNLGIARENANAILKFQTVRDLNGDGTADAAISALANSNPFKFYPINFYDPREGEWRDVAVSTDAADTTCALGGIMNAVDLDVNNLRLWLNPSLPGGIPGTGTQTESATQHGYILYFSDRRGQVADDLGNPRLPGQYGQYGYEDIIDAATPNGVGQTAPLNPIPPNGVLEPPVGNSPEDVNENGQLDTYGAFKIGDGFGALNGNPSRRVTCGLRVASNLAAVDDLARKNRVTGARHVLKLVNGARTKVPTAPDGTGGFTVASENPVYVQGNYNADTPLNLADAHAAASVIADAVTLLSSTWSELKSFKNPTRRAQGTRIATATSYRVAVAAGKGKSFQRPTWAGAAEDFGTDGGIHNFLRYIEDWGGITVTYRGSLVSLYYSEYGTGVYKYGNTVYNAPTRNYAFDLDFLEPTKLPPGTPRFRDIVNLGFQQIFTPY